MAMRDNEDDGKMTYYNERVPLWLVNEDDDKITYLQHNKGKECLYGHTQHLTTFGIINSFWIGKLY